MGADVDACQVLVERVVKSVIVRRNVFLQAMVFGMLIFRAVVQLPFAELVLLVDVYVIAVDFLLVVRAKQVLGFLVERLRAVFVVAGIVAAYCHSEWSGVSQGYVMVVDRRQHSVCVGEVAKRAGR